MGFYKNLLNSLDLAAAAGAVAGPPGWGITIGAVISSSTLRFVASGMGDFDDPKYDKCPICGKSGATKFEDGGEVKACYSCDFEKIKELASKE